MKCDVCEEDRTDRAERDWIVAPVAERGEAGWGKGRRLWMPALSIRRRCLEFPLCEIDCVDK